MENKLQIFENPQFGKIRTVEINGEVYFVGKDVAEILGYANTNNALKNHVDEEDKIVINEKILKEMAAESKSSETRPLEFSFDSPRGLTFINESGLYSLILSSKLPKAKEFKRWVTSEVLPAIRKHGAYFNDDMAKSILNNPHKLMEIFQNFIAEREEKNRLAEVVEVQNLQIAEMRPKASYYDLILQSKEALPISIIAKDYGMSGKTLNKILHDLKVQYPMSGTWLVYHNYAAKGYTCTKTYPLENGYSKTHTYWTQKGRLFLYDLLKNHGYLPTIEKVVA